MNSKNNDISNCPLFSRIEYMHIDGSSASGWRKSWWGGHLLDRDCAKHRVKIETDLGAWWVPMGSVSFLSAE